MADPAFVLGVRLDIALAFEPAANIKEAFEEKAAIYSQEATAVLDYFEDTYMRRPARRGSRHGALFPLASGNTCNRVMENMPHTNDAVRDGILHFNRTGSISSNTVELH